MESTIIAMASITVGSTVIEKVLNMLGKKTEASLVKTVSLVIIGLTGIVEACKIVKGGC